MPLAQTNKQIFPYQAHSIESQPSPPHSGQLFTRTCSKKTQPTPISWNPACRREPSQSNRSVQGVTQHTRRFINNTSFDQTCPPSSPSPKYPTMKTVSLHKSCRSLKTQWLANGHTIHIKYWHFPFTINQELQLLLLPAVYVPRVCHRIDHPSLHPCILQISVNLDPLHSRPYLRIGNLGKPIPWATPPMTQMLLGRVHSKV